MAYAQAQQAHHGSNRSVGFMLGTGIFLFPVIFAWFLLRKGYSITARLLAFGWMAAICGVIIMQPAKNSAPQSSVPAQTVAADDEASEPRIKPWLPEGFTKVSDIARESNVKAGFQWTTVSEASCSGTTACTGITVIPAKNCESLYVNLSIEDANGNNIGFTTATTANVAKYQAAKLTFTTYTEGAQKFRLQEVKCRN